MFSAGLIFWATGVRAADSCVGFSGQQGEVCTLGARSADDEGDNVHYTYSWGDGSPDTWAPSQNGIPEPTSWYCDSWVQPNTWVPQNTWCWADHTWETAGAFTIYVYAYDEAGNVLKIGNELQGTPVPVTINSLELLASLTITTPSNAGWYNNNSFAYTAFCQADYGDNLNSCVLEVSQDGGSYTTAADAQSASCIGQTSCSYDAVYTYVANQEGHEFKYRLRVTDSSGSPPNNTTSYVVPSAGDIGYDESPPDVYVVSDSDIDAEPLLVTAPFLWLLDEPNYLVGPNSGISEWDLRYKKSTDSDWTTCKNNISITQATINFGSDDIDIGCSPITVTLESNTRYCFQARGRDNTDPANEEVWDDSDTDGDSCTNYQVTSPPNEPILIFPANGSNASVNTQLRWTGGDPDSVTVNYTVYLDTVNPPVVIDNPTSPISGGGNPLQVITYSPNTNLQSGLTYYWKVKAEDESDNTNESVVWSFKVNSPPVVSNVDITPTIVNQNATVSWTVRDVDGPPAQDLTFDIAYGVGNKAMASNLTLTGANCGVPIAPNYTYNCSYSLINWSCEPEVPVPGVQIKVKATDEIGDDSGYVVGNTFEINHTQPFTVNGSYSKNGPAPDAFTINPGSIDSPTISISTSDICTAVVADANAVGNETTCNGGNCTNLELKDLTRGSNSISFDLQEDSCLEIDYTINYNLITTCDKPYVQVDKGSIYSQGNIKAEFQPPENKYNASYLILGGGAGTTIVSFISGYCSAGQTEPPPINCSSGQNAPVPINSSFGKLIYPGASNSSSPRAGSFDYYGLTHKLNGSPVGDGEKNSYGHIVKITTDSDGHGDINLVGGLDFVFQETTAIDQSKSLDGKVYWVKGDLTINEKFTFNNTNPDGPSGAGLFIVDGDLKIDKDLFYDDNPLLAEALSRNLASVGWLVNGDVIINDSVKNVVGTFFVSGVAVGSTGTFSTGAGGDQLVVSGAVIAKKFNFERPSSSGDAPSEKIVADGRLLLNTPPGFFDIVSTLPIWRFHSPGQ